MRDDKMLLAFGDIDEKYLAEARPRRRDRARLVRRLTVAASLVLVIGVSLAVGLSGMLNPGGGLAGEQPNGGATNSPNDGTEQQPNGGMTGEPIVEYPFGGKEGNYSDLVAVIDRYKNQGGSSDDFFEGDDGADAPSEAPDSPGDGSNGSSSDSGLNGEYVENTDNQVAGVVEGDLMKMTDKYIFRIGYEQGQKSTDKTYVLRVYSVDKEESAIVSSFVLPKFDRELEKNIYNAEMYLSKDAGTITLILTYKHRLEDKNTIVFSVGVMSLDVSDVNNIKEKNKFSVYGSYESSRMIDGKLLLFTEQTYYGSVDSSDPTTFVPSVYIDGERRFVNPEDICIPENINMVSYSTVFMVNEGGLEIVDVKSLLGYANKIYVSENNIFIARNSVNMYEGEGDIVEITEAVSDISVIGYSKDGFTDKGIATVSGTVKDQYSFDERDGHLRVVTTTRIVEKRKVVNSIYQEYYHYSYTEKTNASLFVIDLSNNSVIASVDNFAPEGEEAVSTRFEGDKLYVCTAIVRLFTDPVYFFYLSDYDNITCTDTGYINGFSTSLIDLGEGYLLGIGREDRQNCKIAVYKKDDNGVVAVDKVLFAGKYSERYKAYLIDRENNLFGFGVESLYNPTTDKYEKAYIVLKFDADKISVVEKINVDSISRDRVRAAIVDGYLYITTDTDLVVEKLNLN